MRFTPTIDNKEESHVTNKELESKVAALEDQVMSLARKYSQAENVNVSLMAKLREELNTLTNRVQRISNDVETLMTLSKRNIEIGPY